MVWAGSILLAVLDLMKMAVTISFGTIVFVAILLGVYSIPFFLMWRFLPLPRKTLFLRISEVTVLSTVLFIIVLMPLMRYFPNYRPDALEGLKYLFGSLMAGAIALVLLPLHQVSKRAINK